VIAQRLLGSFGSIPGVDRVGRKMANFGRWRVKTALPLAGLVALRYHVGTNNGRRMQIHGRYCATVPLIQQAALEIQIMKCWWTRGRGEVAICG
jgi:hypothetical protein